jgi:hypothetical protein
MRLVELRQFRGCAVRYWGFHISGLQSSPPRLHCATSALGELPATHDWLSEDRGRRRSSQPPGAPNNNPCEDSRFSRPYPPGRDLWDYPSFDFHRIVLAFANHRATIPLGQPKKRPQLGGAGARSLERSAGRGRKPPRFCCRDPVGRNRLNSALRIPKSTLLYFPPRNETPATA